jgi:tape measure domain
MADRISVSYDANVDDLKRKLDELIAKNKELAAHATAAAKALSNIASAQGLSTINNINNSFNTTVNVLAQVNTNLTQVNNQLNNTVNLGRQTSNTLNNIKVSADLLTRAFQFLAARMVAAFSINAIINFGNSVVDVERKMELLQNRINFVFDSANAGSLAFSRLRKMSIELGIEFSSLAEGFASFGIAAKMAGFSASETEKVFGRVAVGLRAAGAGSLQTQRAFYALQQMLSKGVVAAEELRRQLGEALPGASDLMTQAYNRLHPGQELTNRQFTKMLEEGKIISKEILPEFSKVIEEVFAPALSGKQNSLDASIQRVTTQLERFKQSLANFLPTKTVFNVLSDFFDDLNTMMEAGFFNFTKLAALAATGNLTVLTAEFERLRGIREAEQIKAEREETELQKRIEQRAQLYFKQGVTSEKAISGETDRIKEQREELKGLIQQLEKLEIAEKQSAKALMDDRGLKQKEDAIKAVSVQKTLIEEKKKR